MKTLSIIFIILSLFGQGYVLIILHRLKFILNSMSWFFISFGLGITFVKWSLGLYIIANARSISFLVMAYEFLSMFIAVFFVIGFNTLYRDMDKAFHIKELKSLKRSGEFKREKL